jgi:hypothetical protein
MRSPASNLYITCFSAKILRYSFWFGAIAQLARAPALQAGGPGFESPLLHHLQHVQGAIAQLVRARH